MKKPSILFTLALISQAGCATTARDFREAGYSNLIHNSEQDLENAFHACEIKAAEAGYDRHGGLIEAAGGGRRSYLQSCLEALGWRKNQQQSKVAE